MEKPIWEWSLEQIRTVTDRARAGRDLTPSSWPNGARVAVALSFDFDAETGWLRRNQHSPAAMARGGYGVRVGISRILDLFDKYDLPASFFIPAVAAQLHPGAVDAILKCGRHEIGIHGWIHELAQDLTPDQERELLTLDDQVFFCSLWQGLCLPLKA